MFNEALISAFTNIPLCVSYKPLFILLPEYFPFIKSFFIPLFFKSLLYPMTMFFIFFSFTIFLFDLLLYLNNHLRNYYVYNKNFERNEECQQNSYNEHIDKTLFKGILFAKNKKTLPLN